MTFKLKENIKIGKVSLNVKDLDLLVDFYTNKIGLDLIKNENGIAELGVDENVLLELVQVDKEIDKKTTGLYHIAYLVPTRADLGNALFSLLVKKAPLYGASDHGYSEALYLNDPEGNGIEIYADRPKDKWDIREDGTIAGYTLAMDAEGVLGEKTTDIPVNLPKGTVIGHIHLSVKDLDETKDFYTNILGFDNKFEFPRQAIFIASGIYHHHIAINIWDSANMSLREDGDLGLNYFEIIVEDKEELDRIKTHLENNNISMEKVNDGLMVKDNQNIKILLDTSTYDIYKI